MNRGSRDPGIPARPAARTPPHLGPVIVFALAALIGSRSAHGAAVVARKAALSTASPLATKAGLTVLQRGGNAADAAVAAALALAVVHPQAGNLGGGGFLLYYEAKSGGVWVLDFRETAPRDVSRETYSKSDLSARTGVLSAGVPGTVAGLEALHQRFGTRGWKELVEPAILLAREGVRTDPELEADLASNSFPRRRKCSSKARLHENRSTPTSSQRPSSASL